MFHSQSNNSPTKIVAIFFDGVAIKDILQVGPVRTGCVSLKQGGKSDSLPPRKRYTHTISTRTENLSEGHGWRDVRKEQCPRIGARPVLPEQPEMVAPDQALPARPDFIVPVVISELEGLVHPAIAIAEVGRLRDAEMGTEAFDVTW
jgi:hypothetical protein